MDSEELKAACVMAGLRIETADTVRIEDDRQPLTLHIESVLLPAYVASLLVAKVRDSGNHAMQQFTVELCDTSPLLIDDEQRIRAAMKVLGDE